MGLIEKRGTGKMWWIWIIFAIYALMSALGLLFIKIGSSDTSLAFQNGLFSMQVSPKLIWGLVLYICSFLLSLYIISSMRLTLFYPMATGTVLVLTCIAGIYFLKEHMGAPQIIGAALVLCGIVFMNIRTE